MLPIPFPPRLFLATLCLALLVVKSLGYQSPKIKAFVFSADAQEGQREQVTCSLTKGDPPVTFSWLKDNGELIKVNKGGPVVKDLDDHTSILTINAVSSQDIGNYTCMAVNSYGRDTYTAALLVKASPVWLLEPKDSSVTEGGQVVIECSVRGYPQPRITWSRKSGTGDHGEVSQPLGQGGRIQALANGSLQVQGAQRTDEGLYTCQAANGVGETLSKTVQLSVHAPPKVVSLTERITVTLGHAAKLECKGRGDQPLSVIWFRGQTQLQENERFEIHDRPTDDGIISEIIVITVSRMDAGTYQCRVQSQFGQDNRQTRIRVVETPEPPRDVRVTDIWSRSVAISWLSSYDGGVPLAKYIVQYWKDLDGMPHRLQEKTVLPGERACLITELSPGVQYALRIIAENEVGRGQASETVTCQTEEEAPAAAPTDVAVVARGTTTITLNWKPPPREYWNGALKGYYVGHKVQSSTDRYAFFTVTADGETSQYTLTHLASATRYSLVVSAFNAAGTGPASHELQVDTRDTPLVPSPQQWYASRSTTTTLTFKWQKIQDPIKVTHLMLHYRPVSSSSWQEVRVPNTDTTHTLEGLEPGNRYQVYLTAHSGDNLSSEPTETLSVYTEIRSAMSSAVQGDPSLGETAWQRLPIQLARLEVIVPLLSCLVIIITVAVMACAYVARSKARYIAMADVQCYESNRLSQSYRPMTPVPQSQQQQQQQQQQHGGSIASHRLSKCDYDVPWDNPANPAAALRA